MTWKPQLFQLTIMDPRVLAWRKMNVVDAFFLMVIGVVVVIVVCVVFLRVVALVCFFC